MDQEAASPVRSTGCKPLKNNNKQTNQGFLEAVLGGGGGIPPKKLATPPQKKQKKKVYKEAHCTYIFHSPPLKQH